MLWQWLLPQADMVVSYTSIQNEWLLSGFSIDQERVVFIPFGVDVRFFEREQWAENSYSCLAVGTNEGKDFVTLVRALPKDVKLTIVTDSYNLRAIRKVDDNSNRIEVLHDIPIVQLKRYYQQAGVHVIPMFDTKFSSGQTVLLENMALGKTVIVSDTCSVCDYVKDGITALVVQPMNVEQLHERIESVLQNPQSFLHIGLNAAEIVRSCFSSERYARQLISIIDNLLRLRKSVKEATANKKFRV